MTESKKREKTIREALSLDVDTKSDRDILNDINRDICQKIMDQFYNYYYLARREGMIMGQSAIGFLNMHLNAVVKKVNAEFEEREKNK